MGDNYQPTGYGLVKWSKNDETFWNTVNNKKLNDTPSSCLSETSSKGQRGGADSTNTDSLYGNKANWGARLRYNTTQPMCRAGWTSAHVPKGVGSGAAIGLASAQQRLATSAGSSGGGRKKTKRYRNKKSSRKYNKRRCTRRCSRRCTRRCSRSRRKHKRKKNNM